MRQMRWIDQLTKRTVVAHLRDGVSVRGVLFAAYKDCFVLVSAVYLSPSGDQTAVDGEVVIPRESVSWIQAIGSETG
jgi:hypothetical protein